MKISRFILYGQSIILLYPTPSIKISVQERSHSAFTASEIQKEINTLKQRIAFLEQKLQRLHHTPDKKNIPPTPNPSKKRVPTAYEPIAQRRFGFKIQSEDGQHSLQIRALTQADARFYLEDRDIKNNDTLLLRRARLILEADLYKHRELNLQAEFSGNSPQIIDANINAHFTDALQVRAGKLKSPIGLESLQLDPTRLFNETSLVTNLVPGRDIGVQVHGSLWEEVLQYQIGLFNGAASGTNGPNQDTDSHREMAARLFFHPFRNNEKLPILENIGIGIAFSHGEKSGSAGLPTFRTDGQQSFIRFQQGTQADGDHTRIAPQAYGYWKNFGFLAEYVHANQELKSPFHHTGNLETQAWHLAASWVITGEEASYRGIRPRRDFTLWERDPEKRGWGAIELALRFAQLQARHPDYTSILQSSSATQATAWGIGLNWYLNEYVRVGINYFHTHFDDIHGATDHTILDDEQTIITRFQFLH
jgi:phosphate-selective porin OprO/OprP